MRHKVAIITRTKNRLPLLKRALASVEAQTFQDWLHVIVNDGGDVAALDERVKERPGEQQARTRVIHLPESVGMQNASNSGIEQSDSEFICIHDDDDEWHPEYLEAVTGFLDNEGPESIYQGVITGTEEVVESLKKNGKIKEISRKRHIPLDEISLFRMGYENPFPPIAFCYRRSAWEAVGGYNPRWDLIGDFDFNLRFLLKFEIGIIHRILAYYRIRQGSKPEGLSSSISEKKTLHKRLFNEFKNTHFRKPDPEGDGSLALGLNLAPYLVEAQWMLDDVFHRTKLTEKAIETLGRAIALNGYEDRFQTIREALAILVDHARARHATAARLEELIRAVGLPSEGGNRPVNIQEALAILVENARDERFLKTLDSLHLDLANSLRVLHQGLGKSLGDLHQGMDQSMNGLHESMKQGAQARQATAARLEELIRSVGLPGEEAESNLTERLTGIFDFVMDPGRNGQNFRSEVFHLIENLEDRIRHLEERSVKLRIGKLPIGTIGPDDNKKVQ